MNLELQKSNASWQGAALHLVVANASVQVGAKEADSNQLQLGASLILTSPQSIARKLVSGIRWGGTSLL